MRPDGRLRRIIRRHHPRLNLQSGGHSMTTLRDALATLSGQAGSPAPAGTSTLTHLECTYCDQRFDADQLQTVCSSCGKVLYARYDLARARHTLTRDSLARRRWDMWRYQEVLPVRDAAHIVSLGEGMTP